MLRAALADANDDLFVVGVASTLASLRIAGVSLRVNVGLVNLNDTRELRLVEFSHRVANAMAEIPRRSVLTSKSSLELIGAYALF